MINRIISLIIEATQLLKKTITNSNKRNCLIKICLYEIHQWNNFFHPKGETQPHNHSPFYGELYC